MPKRIIDGYDLYGSYHYLIAVFINLNGKKLSVKLKKLIKLPSYNNILYTNQNSDKASNEFPIPEDIKPLLKPEKVSPWMLPPTNIYLNSECECVVCGFSIVLPDPGEACNSLCTNCSWEPHTWTRDYLGSDAWEYFERNLNKVSLETMKKVFENNEYRQYLIRLMNNESFIDELSDDVANFVKMVLVIEK